MIEAGFNQTSMIFIDSIYELNDQISETERAHLPLSLSLSLYMGETREGNWMEKNYFSN
jgi:hypothetical protein